MNTIYYVIFMIQTSKFCFKNSPESEPEELITNGFEIHSLQFFPGVIGQTTLSKSFTLQGIIF